jgi:hypothetical protein
MLSPELAESSRAVSIGERRRIGVVVIMLAIAIVGTLLALRGWREQIPSYDYLVDVDNAYEFVSHLRIPDRGVLNSYASYIPPGASWLTIPGVLLSDDPRLFGYAASIALYIGTLLGIFVLARSTFGNRCALFAVALYAFSELGLRTAQSLWQRNPLPFFYVWMTYCAIQWCTQRRPRYLMAALTLWAAGLYVFMEIAPALFTLPLIWLLYRPPLKVHAVVLAGLAGLAIWYPYLRFESGRNFVDVRSQVLREDVLPANYKAAWCDQSLIEPNWNNRKRPTEIVSGQEGGVPGLRARALTSLRLVWEKIDLAIPAVVSNFEKVVQIRGVGATLAVLSLATILLVAVSTMSKSTIASICGYWIPRVGIVSILAGVALNEFVIGRFFSVDHSVSPSTAAGIRVWQTILVIVGVSLVMLRGQIIRTLVRFASDARKDEEAVGWARTANILVISLLVPWAVLLPLVEPTRTNRFWWLWPLDVVFLAAAVTYIPQRLRAPRFLSYAAMIVLLLIVAANPLVSSSVRAWINDGWSGRDAEELQVVRYVTEQARSENKREIAVGYDFAISNFYATFHAVDARYKVGAPLDVLFKSRGIANTNGCAEGFSNQDEYRIVQITNNGSDPTLGYRLNAHLDPSFTLLNQIGAYQVFRRR